MEFQSTHPRGVRLFLSIFLFAYTDFNPRTRVGCDGVNDYATKPSTYFNPRTRVGCDLNNGGKKLCHINFNPRTRVGCDQRKRGPSVRHHVISIHAPAWGATVALIKGITGSLDFNPRTRVGCDHNPKNDSFPGVDFNPRTRVGCDGPMHRLPAWMIISIHAPAWGATSRSSGTTGSAGAISIHAPAWGATALIPTKSWNKLNFNPRTRVGCDSKNA